MLIILPPSETKTHHADPNSPFTKESLKDFSFPTLTKTRSTLIRSLITLCSYRSESKQAEARTLLGLTENQDQERIYNSQIWDSPTCPAIERYTGVAYDALDVNGITHGSPLSSTARGRLAIGSALWGIISAEDPIPYYRLSASSKLILPRSSSSSASTIRSLWGKHITHALEKWQEQTRAEGKGDAIIDLRSGSYQALGPLPSALTLDVETYYPDGSRKVVSHFNKHYKGLVARFLAECEEDLSTGTNGEDIASQAHRLLSHHPAFIDAGFQWEIRPPRRKTNPSLLMSVPAPETEK